MIRNPNIPLDFTPAHFMGMARVQADYAKETPARPWRLFIVHERGCTDAEDECTCHPLYFTPQAVA